MHNNSHQHGTRGGVSGVWRGAQAKDYSPSTPCQVRGSIPVKVHVFSGNDAVSKVGTKHAALTCNPFSHTYFAETDSLTTVSVVERYIVKVWDGACANNTYLTYLTNFDCYLNGKALTDLPQTSSVTLGGVSTCVIRNAITLLESHIKTLVVPMRSISTCVNKWWNMLVNWCNIYM